MRNPDPLATLARRLTPRDRYVLRLLHEHRVLTTGQITQLAFGSYSVAAHRLAALYQMRAVERFRPFRPLGAGSTPWHYVLDEPGARVLAAEDDTTLANLGYRRIQAVAIQHSRQLAHLVGTNGLFTALAAAARTDPSAQLVTWWSQRRCANQWGNTVRPDSYGRWTTHDRVLDFFLEYDTGTETLDRLAAKLDSYAELAEATGITTTVLFWFPGPRREANFRRHVARPPAVPVATASAADTSAGGPAGPVWLPLPAIGNRRRLTELPAAQPRPANRALAS